MHSLRYFMKSYDIMNLIDIPDDCLLHILYYLRTDLPIRACCSYFKTRWGNINKSRLSRLLQSQRPLNSCVVRNCMECCLGNIRWCERSIHSRYMPYCIIHFYTHSLMASYTMAIRDSTLTVLIPF